MPVGSVSVAPVRFVPVNVTATFVPTTPETGEIDVSVGGAGTVLKGSALLDPPAVLTETLDAAIGAVRATANVALIDVAVLVTAVAVTPVGRFNVAPARVVPAIVTGNVVPMTPNAGGIVVRMGPVTLTPKDSGLLIPFAVVTVNTFVPGAAVSATPKLALILSPAAETVTPAAVIPVGMLNVGAARLKPLISTGTVVPTTPEAGRM